MEAVKKLNVQRIEFDNHQEWITIYGIIEDPDRNPSRILSKIKFPQEELNRIINRLQATCEDDEVLSYLHSEEINDDNIYYTINLQGTNFATSWIELPQEKQQYVLIRA